FTEGKPNGFLSYRSEIWRDTDNARAGMLPWVFEPGMGFERWVDYALDVPMYFVKRGDEYIDVAGASFRDLLAGKLPEMPGDRTVLDVARDCLAIARRGLSRRDRTDVNDCDETRYLESMEEFTERGITPAEELLEKYHGPWGRSVEPVFTEYAY